MKSKYILISLGIFLLLSVAIIVYLKAQEYQIQMRNVLSKLDNSQASNNQLSYDLKAIQTKYDACINDQTVNSPDFRRTISFQELGIYSPLLATQSGSVEIWDYKGTTQTVYQANLQPYNSFRILVIVNTSKFPFLMHICKNSPIDPKYSVCGIEELNLSDFLYKGLTKKGFPYYQNNPLEVWNTPNMYETYIQLPQTDKQENRIIQITYTGKLTDSDYQQYRSLIQEIDTKSN